MLVSVILFPGDVLYLPIKGIVTASAIGLITAIGHFRPIMCSFLMAFGTHIIGSGALLGFLPIMLGSLTDVLVRAFPVAVLTSGIAVMVHTIILAYHTLKMYGFLRPFAEVYTKLKNSSVIALRACWAL